MGLHSLTLQLEQTENAELVEYTKEKELSKRDALRKALKLLITLNREIKAGARIYVQRADGTTAELLPLL